MTTDWGGVLLRWCLYVDLMLVFGLPLFALLFLRGGPPDAGLLRMLRRIAGGAAGVGLLLSVSGLLFMCLRMSGAESFADMGLDSVHLLAMQTDFGRAWQLRMACLLVALGLGLGLGVAARRLPGRSADALACVAGAAALASLAWAGHGAMDEGVRRYQHLATDIAHLLAAGAWTGALVAFLVAGYRFAGEPAGAGLFARCLSGFARTGTVIVAVLLLSGVVNYLLTVGATVEGLLASDYGRLLGIKLCLFGLMLGLASLNRLRLVPALERAFAGADRPGAVRAVRRSVLLESLAALLLLGAVAWLGMLPPTA